MSPGLIITELLGRRHCAYDHTCKLSCDYSTMLSCSNEINFLVNFQKNVSCECSLESSKD